MSAYIVSNETISTIAKGLVEYGIDCSSWVKFTDSQLILVSKRTTPIGQALLEQNYKSVNYRYRENTPTPEFKYVDIDLDEGKLYGCIRCYNYQACETEGYEKSQLYYSLEELKAAMLERMIQRKGYEIPWGI